MNTYAIVSSNTVINLIIWDGNKTKWQPPSGTTAVKISSSSAVNIGDSYDSSSGEFTSAETSS